MTTFAQPFEDYEILDRVGGGAMGTVFKARHKRLNRIVALKVLKPSLARDKRYVDRLRREARIVASLSHPHIVTGYDLGDEGGYHFFVMEFVEGKSLRQLLVEWGMFAEEYVLKVARQVAEALDHAYARDVIHRDIKPGNILIDEHGDVKLTDMGLAKGPADLALTRDGATVGTPMYISPEQARNPQDVDVRTDLYSLGATLYHMATGMPPFRGDTMAELITNVLNENVVPPDEANSAVSGHVSLVIRKLLAKNLATRYQTPRELLDDLDRIKQSQPPAVDVGRLEAEASDSGSWVRPVLLAVAAAVLATVAWLGGRAMVEPNRPDLGADEFLQELRGKLRELPSPGARFLRLQTVNQPPSGALQPLEHLRLQVSLELQAAVDAVVADLQGSAWPAIEDWLQAAAVWPDASQFERDYLQPRVRARAGLPLQQMPPLVRQEQVAAVRDRVERVLAQRDGEFFARFDEFVTSVLPGRATARLRVGDFAAAEQLWVDAMPAFCDGVQQPLPERLPAVVRERLEQRLERARQTALHAIDQTEQAMVAALQRQVAETTGVFERSLQDGGDPAVVREALQRFRRNLNHFWPGAKSFRVANDPWPGLEQQLLHVEHVVDLRDQQRLAEHFERRCDFAWRAFCHGDAAAAAAVLQDMEPATAEQRGRLEQHRRCLDAARQVEQAILKTIAARPTRPVAFLLRATEPYELRVVPEGESLRLVGEALDQPLRPLQLSELRLAGLLADIDATDAEPMRNLLSADRALGLAALRLVGDDLADFEYNLAAIAGADRQFLLEEVAERIKRVRNERDEQAGPVDRFEVLAAALAGLEQGQSVRELERALLALRDVTSEQCTVRQWKLLKLARLRREQVNRGRNRRDELVRRAPRGARVQVEAEDGQLVGSVALKAEVLHADAGDGWQLRGDVLEFAGGNRPWSEQPQVALRGNPGFGPQSHQTRLEIELAFPTARVASRSYLIEFDGISMVFVVAADDSVQVELVDGRALDQEKANAAFARALAARFAAPEAFVLPGTWHRLTIDVHGSAPTQAAVVVTFEGKQLLKRLRAYDQARLPTFALHPLQEVNVRRVAVRAVGL